MSQCSLNSGVLGRQKIAQLPFGKPTVIPGEKEFKPLEERVKVFK